MNPIIKTIAKDIIVLSAQAIAFRLAANAEQQDDVIFAAVPTKTKEKGPIATKAPTAENGPLARKVGF